MEDLELYADEDEEAMEEEGSNRTFIILVGALGGLLALAICAFVAWAIFVNPRMSADIEAQNHSVQATNEAAMATAEEAARATIPPTDTPTPLPTDTPQPTNTKRPTATAVPPTATVGEVAEGTGTPPSLTVTRRPTATPRPVTKHGVPDTGIGALGAGALAVGLLFLLIVVRCMRRPA